MDTSKIKTYAPKARNDFIEAVTQRANRFGIFGDDHIEEISFKGDVAMIGDRAVTQKEGELREKLVQRVQSQSFDMMIRSMAYTWFNRFVALRYMELHDYLDHGLRVLSHPQGSDVPEIVSRAADVDLPGLDKDKVLELRLAGNRDNELYRMIIVAQCNALHQAMPFLFEPIDSETELLLPDNLLHSDSPIRKLVTELDESLWQDVEIIGWIYQFYISEKKSEVIGKTVKSEDIPAATQLFTPNWIVKYMVQNTLGRMWLATYPDSPLRDRMDFYIEPAEQEPEVQKQLEAITPDALNAEEITFMDPACGSGHILVEAYDIFKQIYQERGYRTKEIPGLILKNNLYGLEIDDRAAQLAGFAVLMRARADDRNIFSRNSTPLNIMSIQPSMITDHGNIDLFFKEGDYTEVRKGLTELATLFENAKTFGSLITIPGHLTEKLGALQKAVDEKIGKRFTISRAQNLVTLVRQARILAKKYDSVVTNPPYMGNNGMNLALKDFAKKYYSGSKTDLFSMFMVKNSMLAKQDGSVSMVTMQSWMFLSSYEKLREWFIASKTLTSMLHLGARAFSTISGEVVQTTTFTFFNKHLESYRPRFFRLVDADEKEKLDRFFNGDGIFEKVKIDDFHKIPGSPIAYWVSEEIRNTFINNKPLSEYFFSDGLTKTGNNEKYLRFHWEISRIKARNPNRYRICVKGGEARDYYGNIDIMINWSHQARTHYRADNVARITPQYLWERSGISWTKISSKGPTFRWFGNGMIAETGGPAIFSKPHISLDLIWQALGFLSSKVSWNILSAINPTLNFQTNDVLSLPFNTSETYQSTSITKKLLQGHKTDWAESETSWDFSIYPFLDQALKRDLLWQSYSKVRDHWHEMTIEMKRLEEENNRIFIEAYGLQDELTPDVPLEEITLTCNPYYRYGGNKSEEELEAQLRTDTIKELISYAIGCMMGRYSLDEPGLIYAREGNIGFDPEWYKTFPADDDAITPVMDRDWFEDDATHRFVEFIKTAWPEEYLEENLRFVAESLGPKNNEAPVETIRRYISVSFFKDHLRMYKNRPIYWLFSSGKHKAFECLVYLHRYNEASLSRMRSLYVTPLQGNFSARMQYLKNELDAVPSASAKKKIQKEIDLLGKKQTELAAFDDQLRHLADQKITLDLDDGVKVNYAKFDTLLVKTKAVCGK